MSASLLPGEGRNPGSLVRLHCHLIWGNFITARWVWEFQPPISSNIKVLVASFTTVWQWRSSVSTGLALIHPSEEWRAAPHVGLGQLQAYHVVFTTLGWGLASLSLVSAMEVPGPYIISWTWPWSGCGDYLTIDRKEWSLSFSLSLCYIGRGEATFFSVLFG